MSGDHVHMTCGVNALTASMVYVYDNIMILCPLDWFLIYRLHCGARGQRWERRGREGEERGKGEGKGGEGEGKGSSRLGHELSWLDRFPLLLATQRSASIEEGSLQGLCRHVTNDRVLLLRMYRQTHTHTSWQLDNLPKSLSR